MPTDVFGLFVLALILVMTVLTLEVSHRRRGLPTPTGDADTRRLLRDLESARDRQ